jgi:hypothetical protein
VDLFGQLLRAQVRAGAVAAARATRERAVDVAESVGREDLIVRAFTAWTEPTPWVSRPYGMVDERMVSVLLRLLLRTDLDPEARCRLLGSLSFELAGEGDPRAAEAAREAIALARDLADPALLALALFAEAWEASWDREPGRRARLAEEIGRIGSEQHLVAYRWCAEHIAATAAAAGNDLGALRATSSADWSWPGPTRCPSHSASGAAHRRCWRTWPGASTRPSGGTPRPAPRWLGTAHCTPTASTPWRP